MAEIEGLPQHFLQRHIDWHHAHHDKDVAGYGEDFLNFHRDLVNDVLTWLRSQGRDLVVFDPWTDIPDDLRGDVTWTAQHAEARRRIQQRPYSFRNLDDFGRFLESGSRSGNLHGWFHEVTRAVYADPLIYAFDTAPRSTYFYNFHGLIQRWRLEVESHLVAPRRVDWEQLQAGELLYDNDVIRVEISPGALPPGPNGEAAVDFVLTSQLWWGKWLNVPDGEGAGANWTISTGAPWFGGRKFIDSVALWAHQVHNGQLLTFTKAKALGVAWPVYQLGGLERLSPNARVTFTWERDA